MCHFFPEAVRGSNTLHIGQPAHSAIAAFDELPVTVPIADGAQGAMLVAVLGVMRSAEVVTLKPLR